MLLKALELSGFKSFAKKTRIEFGSPIVAVVGPNGSGKSNIAEAMRFVLGEQSLKSLRGKRGEDLIWNGSKNVARLGRASVSLSFDNSEKTFGAAYEEVMLSREVHRDGVNEYAINGAKSRLRDVFELLAEAHIGSSAHHILSQGETDRILTVSIKERREIIEDALGLRIYEYKIGESEKKLTKTAANRRETELLRKELAPRMQFLKKQMERIARARNLREELAAKYREYFSREEAYLVWEKESIARGREMPKGELERIDRQTAEVREKITAGEKSTDGGEALLHLEARMRQVREKKDEISRAIGRAEGMMEIEMAEKRRREEKAREKEQEREQTERAKENDDENVQKGEGEQRKDGPANIFTLPAEKARAFATLVREMIEEAEAKDFPEGVRETLSRLKEKVAEFFTEIDREKTEYRREYKEQEEDQKEKMLRAEAAIAALAQERDRLFAEMEYLKKEEEAISGEYGEAKIQRESRGESLRSAERELFDLMAKRREIALALDQFLRREEQAAREESEMKREMGEAVALAGRGAVEYGEGNFARQEEQENREENREEQNKRRKEIERLKIRLEEMGVPAHGGDVEKEFTEVSERDEFLARELADLETSADSLAEIIDRLNTELKNRFEDGLKKINAKFQEFFLLLFGGGTAELSLVVPKKRAKRKNAGGESVGEEEGEKGGEFSEKEKKEMLEMGLVPEEEEAGLEVNLTLPHKRLRGIQMLSGGERTLASIALLFAVSQVNPPPFLVLDETDAALDEANSKKYGDMLAELSKTTQLIIITHNRETMSRAGIIYGITSGQDAVSKVLSIQFEQAEGMMAR